MRETQLIPFVRMEVEPDAEAQVDFGQGAWVVVDGKRKRPHLFRVVLSHSCKGYSEVVWRQTIATTGRSYRLKEHAAIAGKEDKNKKTKSMSNEPSTAEPAS